MNDAIHAARDVMKLRTAGADAFGAPEFGWLGRMQGGRAHFHRRPLRRHTAESEFDVDAIDALPRVDITYSHIGATRVPVDALVAAGARGIVNAGYGQGDVTPDVLDGLKDARSRGVHVVRASRVPGRHRRGRRRAEGRRARFRGRGHAEPAEGARAAGARADASPTTGARSSASSTRTRRGTARGDRNDAGDCRVARAAAGGTRRGRTPAAPATRGARRAPRRRARCRPNASRARRARRPRPSSEASRTQRRTLPRPRAGSLPTRAPRAASRRAPRPAPRRRTRRRSGGAVARSRGRRAARGPGASSRAGARRQRLQRHAHRASRRVGTVRARDRRGIDRGGVHERRPSMLVERHHAGIRLAAQRAVVGREQRLDELRLAQQRPELAGGGLELDAPDLGREPAVGLRSASRRRNARRRGRAGARSCRRRAEADCRRRSGRRPARRGSRRARRAAAAAAGSGCAAAA